MTRRIATFDEFRDAVSAYRLPRLLLVALELDLFTTVGDRLWTIPHLAKELKVSERGLSILCRNLAAVGVLQKNGASYKNSRLGASALNADHRAYRGGYLDLIKRHWADWVRLLDSVRSGLPVDHDMPDSPDYRRQFTWAIRESRRLFFAKRTVFTRETMILALDTDRLPPCHAEPCLSRSRLA